MTVHRMRATTLACGVLAGLFVAGVSCMSVSGTVREAGAARVLVIATSPFVEEAMVQLGRAFEASHPDVRVQLSVDMSIDLRRTIAGMEMTRVKNSKPSPNSGAMPVWYMWWP